MLGARLQWAPILDIQQPLTTPKGEVRICGEELLSKVRRGVYEDDSTERASCARQVQRKDGKEGVRGRELIGFWKGDFSLGCALGYHGAHGKARWKHRRERLRSLCFFACYKLDTLARSYLVHSASGEAFGEQALRSAVRRRQ
jgi:hypothetical protein